MEIRQVEAFLAVVDSGSFTRAADRLQIAQPAVSQLIRNLERGLGADLMQRNRSGVQLTAAGDRLLPTARRLMEEVERGRRDVRYAAEGRVGSIRIGFLASATAPFLPRVIHAFRARFPDVTIDLDEMTPTQQLEAFERRAIDVGCNRPLPPDLRSAFEAMPVYEDRLMAAIPESDPLAERPTVRYADLAGRDFVMFHESQAPELYRKASRRMIELDGVFRVVARPMQMSTVAVMVAAGVGVSIVPGCVRFFRQTGLVLRDFEADQETIRLEAISRREETNPAVANWLQVLKEHRPEIRDLMERSPESYRQP